MSSFFIERPIFAWVISLLILLAGLLSLRLLPIAQYPDIAPPVVNISTMYPGASAQVVEEAVTAVIEKEMNGAPGLMYMSATSSSTGEIQLMLTFEQGTDPDLAAVEVQNRLKVIESRLPEPVRREGVKVEKSSDNIQLMVALVSDGSMDEVEIGEWASARVVQELKRVKGVGKIQLYGAEKAMRIWPDTDKLEALRLTPSDIVAAVASQSARIIIGDIGGSAVPNSAPINASVVAEDALQTVEQFEEIALRTLADGASVRLKDVARVELGASMYAFFSRANGKPSTGMAVKMAPGSNAVETTQLIREKMDELAVNFPTGLRYIIPYETTQFVEISIEKVISTLIEAVILVFLVMFLFLQSMRATLIPTLVVPIALMGTVAVMWMLGFSINMLTMFGMVLSIGILVDDAIVVVENVERIMAEEGLSPREATIKAMKQISGAIVGITAVLTSVFIPMAFFTGAVGNIYRQFSLTLVVSIGFSAFLALSLTPALCATLLKPASADHHEKRGFFGWFNRSVARSTERYGKVLSFLLRRPLRSLVVYALIIAGAVHLYVSQPTSFLPTEDQGNFIVNVTLPPGTLQNETREKLREIETYLMENEPVANVYTVGGFSFFGTGTNTAIFFVGLKNWSERTDPDKSVEAILGRVTARFGADKRMDIMALNMPALPELGSIAGFDFRLQDRNGLGYDKFLAAREELLQKANQHPDLMAVYFAGQRDIAQLRVSLDRKKAQSMGVPIEEINNSLAVMFGSSYVGDFMLGDQVRRIIIQADGGKRVESQDIGRLHVRSSSGALIPLSSLVSVEWIAGPPQLTRYNNYPSFSINGSAPPGKSSGDAMLAMEKLASELPTGIGFEWTGQSKEEQLAGSQATLLFALSILIVFLVLSALYESWSIPLSVIMVVPLGLLGALLAIFLRDMPNDIYFKVGLITTIGLSAKNAILIVEVAKDLYRGGQSAMSATLEAAKLRLRPIIMTSLAFGVGVVPLAFASGAGAGAQKAIGTGVLGGIITATVLAIFLVPLFFAIIAKWSAPSSKQKPSTPEPDAQI